MSGFKSSLEDHLGEKADRNKGHKAAGEGI